jgi:hypothetical protein
MINVHKLFTIKRPNHPEDAHAKAKRLFKTRGRKRVRKMLKEELKRSVAEG